jgi:hypothetical protein
VSTWISQLLCKMCFLPSFPCFGMGRTTVIMVTCPMLDVWETENSQAFKLNKSSKKSDSRTTMKETYLVICITRSWSLN